jgi:hypothetical protein
VLENQTTLMNIDFTNIFERVTTIDNFELKWRFIYERYDKLPKDDLELIEPLDNEASFFLNDFIVKSNLHKDFPFEKDFFQTVEESLFSDGNEEEIKIWLFNRGLSLEKNVFLSWDSKNALIVPWKILIKYFDSFYYPSSDDLTVFDQSLNWALLFFHDDRIFFGTKNGFKID